MFEVLVAEDEVWIRDAVVEMIEELNPRFTVIGAVDNGEEAWNFIQQSWPGIVVTDIMMPKKNGLWLSEQIYVQQLPVMVVILSGYDNFQYAKQAMRFGISEYLLKPVDKQELHDALRRSLLRLEKTAEYREYIFKIQHFIDQFPGLNQQKQLQETHNLVASLLRLKAREPGIGKNALSLLSFKMNELLQGIQPSRPAVPFAEKEEKGVHKHFRELAEAWILSYTEYANHNVNAAVLKVCEHIKANYYDDFSLARLADMAHLSVSYFSTLFKKVTGKTCLHYLNEVRMEKAKQLLQEADLKIYEIAGMVGYNSMPYFNRMFKELVGMTPAEYRKKLGV